MGLIQSIHEPLVHYGTKIPGEIVTRLLDEIVYEYSSLIADIEDKKVDPSYLKREIEKKVDACKGVFNAEQIKKEIFDTIYGYGLLQPFVEDPDVTDIDAPSYDYILVKKNGKLIELDIHFENEVVFDRFCRVLIIRHGGKINAVDAHCRVSDKANHLRINVSVAPRNAQGASLTIRKHRKSAYGFEGLESLGFLDRAAAAILESANIRKESILICGKGGSGKTTLLRTLVDTGDKLERMLICESDTELYPQKKNIIVQQVQKNKNKTIANSLKTLIQEGLTMSLDAYCIGEITGAEAWPFVMAGHTDHRILGTLHAKSCDDAMDRLLMLVENETRIEEGSLKNMLAGSLDLIIYLKDFKVNEIVKVISYDNDQNKYLFNRLYERSSVNGSDCSNPKYSSRFMAM